MSNLSLSTTETEPPPDDQPLEDALAEETLPDGGDAAVVAGPAEASASAEDETLDLPGLMPEALVDRELQQGKYRVLALRPARGAPSGMAPSLGASYSALHTDLQRRLTLRYLPLDATASAEQHAQATAQFLREARVLARLDHPSLPRVHDYFCEGDACYVVMDELAERTLAGVLAEAALQGRVPALPPLAIARLGLDLARALGYLHQQRPPLALGGLRAEDIALPDDGPAQVVSLGALSLVASASSATLPGLSSLPTYPSTRTTDPAQYGDLPAEPEMSGPGAANPPGNAAPAASAYDMDSARTTADPRDDLLSLGLLLRELAGGAEVVAGVMNRLYRPEEVAQQAEREDAPPISLALASVIEIAAHDDPNRRFQNAAALENALAGAYAVERRIVYLAERAGTIQEPLEEGQDALATVSMEELFPVGTFDSQPQQLATRQIDALFGAEDTPSSIACWRCGGRNLPGALLCRVCGARQPVIGGPARRRAPVRRSTTRKLRSGALDGEWAEWGETEDEEMLLPRQARRPTIWLEPDGRRISTPRPYVSAAPAEKGRRLLWALVWVCFGMAILLGAATAYVTYLVLR
jgi:hypothetical protein